MILGSKKLLQLVKKINLVEGLSERELTNPEGAGFDLRLGEVYKIKGKAFLGVTERHTADIELISKLKTQSSKLQLKTQKITIEPGEFFLVKTVESVNMPENLTASIMPRSTTYRSGLFANGSLREFPRRASTAPMLPPAPPWRS